MRQRAQISAMQERGQSVARRVANPSVAALHRRFIVPLELNEISSLARSTASIGGIAPMEMSAAVCYTSSLPVVYASVGN